MALGIQRQHILVFFFLTLHDPMSDISDRTTINQILVSGFLIFSAQASKVKTTPVAILYFVIARGTQFFVLRYKT